GSLVSIGMIRDFDLSNSISDPTVSGPYYLSMTEPGKLVSPRPAVGVYVLFNRGDDTAHVDPVQKDVLENHIHYKFYLTAEPAGVPNCIEYGDGQHHCIFDADSNLPGWLPADDASFNGTAPEGAKFGYNLSQHPELLRVWPPLPPDTAYVEVNSLSVEVNNGTCPRVIIDSNGIWWMQDCYGAAPWPPELLDCSSSSCGPSSSSSGECECTTPIEYLPGHGVDRMDQMTIVLWFAKMVIKTDEAVVTSLSPCSDNSPISVLNCEGNPQSTGQLCLAVDFSRLLRVETAGYDLVKGFGVDQVLKGPAVTGIKPTSDFTLTGIGTEDEDWEVGADGVYHGEFELALADRAGDPREGNTDLTIVSNVREEYDSVLKVFYLHFPAGLASEVRGRVDVSRIDIPSGNLQMYLWFWFYGRVNAALPTLGATYRRIPLPASPAALPTSDSPIDTGSWLPGLTLNAGQYGQATTEPFDIAAGDQILFSLTWDGTAGPSDGFGILRSGYRITVKP
ncbi:MAG TPA: hypothetical protein VLT59_14895, partial [Steroidobacteraceae bacterium]|nr:hypothetical protein [Steroidobacteraceae bacterium]